MSEKPTFIPEGFHTEFSDAQQKFVLYPDKGYSDKYLTRDSFIPKQPKQTELAPKEEQDEPKEENTEPKPADKNKEKKEEKRNSNLSKARVVKNDEFYTSINDIAKEVRQYKEMFKGKVVYCPCDKVFNLGRSHFFDYFSMYFKELGLKSLICTQYNPTGNGSAKVLNGKGIRWDYNGELKVTGPVDESMIDTTILNGNGSFDSPECIEIMKQCDIVVTNPPFSLFRKFVAQIMECGKQFLIIGSQNAITYKETFNYIKENKLWLGFNAVKSFEVPTSKIENGNQYIDEYTGKIMQKFGNICWFTNMPHTKRKERIVLFKKYDSKTYPTYENYNAIEVSKLTIIPKDYDGVMGVPITFISRYNPEQFEILGLDKDFTKDKKRGTINGKQLYARIFIKKK